MLTCPPSRRGGSAAWAGFEGMVAVAKRDAICIEGGTVVLPAKTVERGSVHIGDGKIVHAGARRARPRGATVIDATGRIVAPGLIDVHIHGAGEFSFELLDADGFVAAARFLAMHGVLRFLPTMMADEGVIERTACALEEGRLDDACPGIYIEGPFVSPDKRGGIQKQYVRGVDLAYLRKLHALARGRLKMMTFAPELSRAEVLVARLRRMKILPCLGHTLATAKRAADVCGRGVVNVTHLFNAMSGLDHKEPGVAVFGLDNDRAWVELNPDGVHVAPELLRLVARAKDSDRIVLITDAVVSAGTRGGTFVYMGRKVRATADGVRYADEGTLVGSRLLLCQSVAAYMKHTGAALHDAVRAASLNPARMLGIAKHTGSLEKGKRADVVVMKRDLSRATHAICGGVRVAWR